MAKSADGNHAHLDLTGHRLKKFASVFFIFLAASTVVYSSYNAYQLGFKASLTFPYKMLQTYLVNHLSQNQSAVIVCASNVIEQDMFWIYLPPNMSTNQVWQYPETPVDAYTANFNITYFLGQCQQRNVKYIILYDYGENMPFFNSTLTYADSSSNDSEHGQVWCTD